MPFIIEVKNDPLYHKGWNEAWNEAEEQRKLQDALLVIKEFNLPIEVVAQKFGLDTKVLLDNLNQNNMI